MLIGTEATVTLSFTNDDGVAADPTAAEAFVKKPNGQQVELTLTNPAIGSYSGSIVPDQAGFYYVFARGSGAVTVVGEGSFKATAPDWTPTP